MLLLTNEITASYLVRMSCCYSEKVQFMAAYYGIVVLIVVLVVEFAVEFVVALVVKFAVEFVVKFNDAFRSVALRLILVFTGDWVVFVVLVGNEFEVLVN